MSYEGQIFVPPPTASWSWYNQGSGTTATIDRNAINTVVNLHGSANSESVSGYYRTAPSTPYTIIMNLVYNSVDPNTTTNMFELPGPGFTDGTKVIWLNPRVYDSGYSLYVSYFSNSTTFSSNDFADHPATATAHPWPASQWFMIRDNGTNIYWYISEDNQENGSSWVQVYTQARTTRLTPSSVGFFFNGRGNTSISCTLNSWLSLGV